MVVNSGFIWWKWWLTVVMANVSCCTACWKTVAWWSHGGAMMANLVVVDSEMVAWWRNEGAMVAHLVAVYSKMVA